MLRYVVTEFKDSEILQLGMPVQNRTRGPPIN